MRNLVVCFLAGCILGVIIPSCLNLLDTQPGEPTRKRNKQMAESPQGDFSIPELDWQCTKWRKKWPTK